MVSASEDTTIRLWTLNDLRAEPTVLTGHKMPVYNVDVSANGATLLSVGFKEPVYAWSMETPDSQPDLLIKAEVPEIGKYPTLALAVSPDDKLLATSEVFGEVRLWAIPDFDQPYATFSTGNQYDIMSLDFSPDGRYLAAGQGSNMVHIWDLAPETPTRKAGEATTVNGLTAEEMLARNSEAMAALDTVRVTMTVDDENRNPAGESGSLSTQMMTATAELQLPGDVHGWLKTQGKTQETLQLDGGPVYVRGKPDENWKLRDGSPALEPTPRHDFLALSTPGTLARMSQFEGMESAGDDEPYQITFAVRPREFFALEPMMTNLASATRTQVTGKAWISRKNLLTQRVLYEITLKTPYVNETVTYVLELDAFDEPVDIPNLKE